MSAGWRAGAASVEFPIPVGTPMGGYAARHGGSEGTLDPLTITALWLETGASALAIVAVDLVAVDEALTSRIAKEAGIDRGALLLAASHTHSGPAGLAHKLHVANEDTIDHRLRDRFVKRCVDTISAAKSKSEPAIVSLGRSETRGLCGDRNDPGDTARVSALTLIDVMSLDGQPVATVFHWPCHPTILGGSNRSISADFPGALRRELQSVGGAESHPVLYLNGAAGDISTRFTRRGQDVREVERVGHHLAATASMARTKARPLLLHLSHVTTSITLSGWSDEELRSELYEQNVSSGADDRRDETRRQGQELLEALAASPCRPRWRTIRLDAWQLGKVTIVAVPGEMLSSLGEKIVSAISRVVLVVGYAGGYAGYLPDRAAYESRTYEALASPFGPGCGEKVVATAVELIRSLQSEIRGAS